MKKILLTITSIFVALLTMAQSPNLMNYQGVARNAVGNVIPNQLIGLRLSILSGGPSGSVVYSETRNVYTNAFGLFNVVVGSPGTLSQTGTIAGVNWSGFPSGGASKYLQVEIDPTGGSNFVNVGSTQLVSVPYALNAAGAAPIGPAGGDLTGTYPNPQILIPLIKTQNVPATPMISMTNTAATGTTGALFGSSASTDANAVAVQGTMTSTNPGGFSAAVRGNNNGAAGLGIGVWGSQNGSGWGVYGQAPAGWGVYGESNTGVGVRGSGITTGTGVTGTSASGIGGRFTSTTGQALSTTGAVQFTGINEGPNKILATVTGTGNATWENPAVVGIVTGNGTLNFVPKWTPTGTNLGNSRIFDDGTFVGVGTTTPGAGLVVAGAGIWNSAIGISNTTSGMEWRMNVNGTTFGITKIPGSTFTPLQLFSTGGMDLSSSVGTSTVRLLDNTNVGITNTAPTYRLDVDATTAGSSNGMRVRNTASFATVDIVGSTTDQALRFGKNGTIYSGINTGNDGDHINFFKFGGPFNAMALNVNTGNLGVGGVAYNAAAKLHVKGFNPANNTYNSGFGGFTGAAGIGVFDNTAQPTIEKWGIHSFVDGGVSAQHGVFSEAGTTASVNTALFGRVSTAPVAGQSYGMLAFDPVNNSNTWAAAIRGRLQYQDGTQGPPNPPNAFKIMAGDPSGNASWQHAAAIGLVSGTGTATRVAFWNSASTITSNSNLYWDNVNNRLGIGTSAPAYPLEVIHGGATGAHIASTASFSVVDIDANSGDAALRFQKAGVGQWNIRNRPADNYLEFFELGGGGSRMVIQDGTGWVGIGGPGATAAPAYQLDVEHGGATGIRSKSTASFSVVDIDAASGDAALRFQKAGVGQWNTRNRPADNYYEIFELGGGGSRFVIQDGTGWVGIGGPGATAAPAYQLDVEHGGATGIRSKSNASFSVVDIDAFSGDAALRFQKAGVGQWNTRNRPADNYYEIFELGGGGSRFVIQDGTGWVGIGATASISPAYQLDVTHGGATGIRSKSDASFSVVDIDAFSGDAALRFQKAGTGMWNTRNEPVNNDYQWFELGGGGERMRIQRGSGNVGINQPAPSYKLDVNHGGATGLRVQSSASFSVVDIDAASGDAALRFIKAGVNKWNTRNEPVNDDYQWFELGGGGERMRIQRGSGNVGINQPAPAYKLDVNHGGATGLRVQSSASFSVVDIDGNSGDAALRFIRAGVNKWNTRNEPVFDDYQIFELGGGGERFRIKRGTGFVGINTSAPATQLEVVGTITGTVKAFTIDHPLDPANKTLRHISIESPEALDVYSGNIVTDAAGKAIVDLPAYFEALNKDFRYQLTVIGAFAQAIISKEIVNNKFEIATNQPNVKVSWQVQGVRNDPYMKNTFDLKMEEDKPASIKGKYYHPESYGLPQSMGVNYNAEPKGSSIENAQLTTAKPTQPEVIKGSSLENKIAKPVTKPVDNTGSIIQTEASKPVNKLLDNTGSIIQTEPAKANAKTIENSGSVINVPVKKTGDKKLDLDGSVSDKQVQPPINNNEEKGTNIEPAKPVKEILPAALKGTSLDPDAKNIARPVEKAVSIPAQHSSNTQPKKDN